MAILRNLHCNSSIQLNAHHLFGRKFAAVDSCLKAPDISQVHAAVRWNGFEWYLEDLSRNGTWLNHQKLIRNKHYALQNDAVIQFGREPHSIWQIQDLAAPSAKLILLEDFSDEIDLSHGAILPNESAPEISIYRNSQRIWVYETSDNEQLLEDGQIITVAGQRWRFHSDRPSLATRDNSSNQAPDANNTIAIFRVSQNEEHVSLQLSNGTDELDLGERTHHYLLLTLARKRLEDIRAGVDSDSQGWIDMDTLTRMLGIDESHANIQVYRARRQIMKHSSPQALDISVVERRSGCLRFGLPLIQVLRGSFIESESIDLYGQQLISA